MKVTKRLCLENYTITDAEGTSFTLERGREYTTSAKISDGEVTVFSRYWVRAPIRIFSGELAEQMVLAVLRSSGLEIERLRELVQCVSLEQAESSDARLTDLELGKAIGSATDSSLPQIPSSSSETKT